MLYKHLLDSLIRGEAKETDVWSALSLDPDVELGDGLKGLVASDPEGQSGNTLKSLWKAAASAAQCLTEVASLQVEYCYQQLEGDGPDKESKDPFAVEEVAYDGAWLEEKVGRCLEYWDGSRTAEGVAVEEAWKCASCDYEEVCEWRKKKAEELSQRKM